MENIAVAGDEDSNVIQRLLISLEARHISQEKIEKILAYVKSNSISTFFQLNKNLQSDQADDVRKDLVYIIEDYNQIITQAIQAIKALQAENLNLKETMLKESQINKKTLISCDSGSLNYDCNLYDRYLSTEEAKDKVKQKHNEISDQVKVDNLKNKDVPPVQAHEEEIHDNFASNIHKDDEDMSLKSSDQETKTKISIIPRQPLREKIKSLCKKEDEITVIKITNAILKKIPATQNYQIYFGKKYAQGSYKDFLHNVIHYVYGIPTLREILNDIEKKIDENPNHKFSEESFSNFIKHSVRTVNETEAFPMKGNPNIPCHNLPNERKVREKSVKTCMDNKNCNWKPAQVRKDNENNVGAFEDILRKYGNKEVRRLPFNRFTRVYGSYFDKHGMSSEGKLRRSKSRE